jgi:hypothetical protein
VIVDCSHRQEFSFQQALRASVEAFGLDLRLSRLERHVSHLTFLLQTLALQGSRLKPRACLNMLSRNHRETTVLTRAQSTSGLFS